jgi:amino acid transporter
MIRLSYIDVGKRILLGKPMYTSDLQHETLSNSVALGALSPDAISSTAYGPEQILVELLPAAGMAAFVLLLPITGVILVILALVAASYRQVVTAYTRAGGSYVVARENFGPRVAQIAAAALLIDYVVTVAIQCAAGTVAVVSAIPSLSDYSLQITVGAVLVFCYANLRGIREAGRTFAIPTYAFIAMLGLMVVVGIVRKICGTLTIYDPAHLAGTVAIHHDNGLVMGASVLVILRAFANGGSSLTGVEAISNTVNLFQSPQGHNARRVLTIMACILGFLLAGVAWLAFATHATPYSAGYPSVLSEIGRAVFGAGAMGNCLYFALQAASAAILYNGANTSFNGFPALANFVARDQFLPRPLMKRGHRLVFSNAILLLTALALVLLLITGGSVNALVPLFAMGVFSAFAMAGFGMTKHHLNHRTPGWRRRLVINLSAGILSALVVGIFAVAKFSDGAWLVVVIFPVLVTTLIRLNRQYRSEETALEFCHTKDFSLSRHPSHQVLLLVNSADLADIEALRYAQSLHAERLSAIHFVEDPITAQQLRDDWALLGHEVELQMAECPDRRLSEAAYAAVEAVVAATPDTTVTVLLPRRTYAPLIGRLLHDRTADKLARVISRIPGATPQIVAYDTTSRVAAVIRSRRLTGGFLGVVRPSDDREDARTR